MIDMAQNNINDIEKMLLYEKSVLTSAASSKLTNNFLI